MTLAVTVTDPPADTVLGDTVIDRNTGGVVSPPGGALLAAGATVEGGVGPAGVLVGRVDVGITGDRAASVVVGKGVGTEAGVAAIVGAEDGFVAPGADVTGATAARASVADTCVGSGIAADPPSSGCT